MTEAKPPLEIGRKVHLEREIEVAAPIEQVWKALTDDKELARRFPPKARVTPGPGGKIFCSLLVRVDAKKRSRVKYAPSKKDGLNHA